jgi:hypothetical protein
MSMRVKLGVTKFGRDPFLETLRDEVLQAFRLIVQFFYGIVQNLIKKSLDQTMVAHDFESPFSAKPGKSDPVMPFILDKRLRFSG